MEFCEKLTSLRKKGDMSQEELGAKLGVSRQTISKWENGDCLPDSFNLVSLSELFDVSVDYLLHGECICDADTKLSKATRISQNKRLRIWGIASLCVSFVAYVVLLILSMNVDSYKAVSTYIGNPVAVESSSQSESDISDIKPDSFDGVYFSMESTRGFFPFIRSYNLEVVFGMDIALAIVGVFTIVVSSVSIKKIKC